MPLIDPLALLLGFLSTSWLNMFLILAGGWCCCALICNVLGRLLLGHTGGPIPDYGGKVCSIHNVAEWQAFLGAAAVKNELVLVDCFATWCPPCRSAAPAFAQMSREYCCRFAKVDVDEASDVARLLGISVMPTFLLFGKPNRGCPHVMQLDARKGWSERDVRRMLESYGIERHAPEPDEPEEDTGAEDESCQLVPGKATAEM